MKIGTCSICGGEVHYPAEDAGTPVCHNCGAKAVHKHGPVIPMVARAADKAPPVRIDGVGQDKVATLEVGQVHSMFQKGDA